MRVLIDLFGLNNQRRGMICKEVALGGGRADLVVNTRALVPLLVVEFKLKDSGRRETGSTQVRKNKARRRPFLLSPKRLARPRPPQIN
jgi:hypothetical protein